MRKKLNIILSSLAGLLSIGIITLGAALFSVDLNQFKVQIETAVKENTGRTLTIAGAVELSLFPWPEIIARKITLHNANGITQPFAQVVESQIKVKLGSLLFNEIEVSDIILKGLTLNLVKNPQGANNWDDLIAQFKNKKNPLKLLEIAAISIENGQIIWDNQQTSHALSIKKFNLNSDKLRFNQPMEIAADFTARNSPFSLTQFIDFTGKLTLNEALDDFSLKQVKLKTQTEGQSVPKGKLMVAVFGDVGFNLKQNSLKFNELEVKTDALTVVANALTTQLQQPFKTEGTIHIPNFDARELLKQYALVNLPQMADDKALTWMGADFYLNADAHRAKLENLEVQLDETLFKGYAQINDFATAAVRFNLSVDKINVDRYLPPTVENEGLQYEHLAKIRPTSHTLFPLETLKKLNLNGQVWIDDLKVSNLIMQGVRLLFNAKNGVVQSQQSVNRLYQGSYNSKIAFDMNQDEPLLMLQQQLSHIQIEPLLTDLQGESRFSGLIDVNAKLEATGNTDLALKTSLNGQLNFLGKDMLIRGFNLQKMVDNGKIMLNNKSLSKDDRKTYTAFSKISGTGIISNGFLSNNDLAANTNSTQVAGMGVINLISQQLDYKIIALLLKERFTATHAKVLDNFPVFINIGGTFDTPAYQVDLAAMGVGL